jgi:hypothetical protein
MAVDFKNQACITQTSEREFGICDDPPLKVNGTIVNTPAYLDYNQKSNWIATVENSASRPVVFTAIDNCVDIRRPNGDKEKSCDGMLQHDTTIIFVELKDRDSSHWLGTGIKQLKATISAYKVEVGLAPYTRFYAIVANKQRPKFNASTTSEVAKFMNETGFILETTTVIKIS